MAETNIEYANRLNSELEITSSKLDDALRDIEKEMVEKDERIGELEHEIKVLNDENDELTKEKANE